MKVKIAELVKLMIDGAYHYFMIGRMYEKEDKALLVKLPSTKNPDRVGYGPLAGYINFSQETQNLPVLGGYPDEYVNLPDSIMIDDEQHQFMRASRREYGERMHLGLYYINETPENPERRIDV